MLKAVNLKVEYLRNPMGMDESQPRFSYEVEGASRYQSARRIIVVAETGDTVWDSGVVESASTNQIEYRGEPLRQFTRYEWRVKIWDEKGVEGYWSDDGSFFETGFLGAKWHAKWISCGAVDNVFRCSPRIVRDFTLESAPVRARLCITSLGLYDAAINGKPVTDCCLTPGWTDYFTRVQYQMFDVTPLLAEGENTLSVQLSGGWYSGRISRLWNANFGSTYGEGTMLLAELRLQFADGRTQIIASDREFRQFSTSVADGFDLIRASDIYDGEHFVRGPRGSSWREPGVGRERTRPMFERDKKIRVTWQSGAPIRRMIEVRPVKIVQRSSDAWLVDFGQNLAGREIIRVTGAPAGTTIVIRHAEMIDTDGSLYVDNLRSAEATTIFTTGGSGTEEYEPKFTFYGFRYIEITGWPGELNAEMVSARVIYSELEKTGDFECSNPLINRLFANIVWGQRGNFVDVPTDCPQRDERLGWTGDTQVFANVATYNLFCAPFYTKWLEDLNSCIVNGAFPHIAPNPYMHTTGMGTSASSGWGDAGVICPEVMFIKYGDTRLIRKYLANICRWLDMQVEQAGGSLIVKNACYGDWLNLDDPTPEDYISTAYLAGMTAKAAKMAALVGDTGECVKRERLFGAIRRAFIEKFFTASGTPRVKSQTAALLALEFNLVPEKGRAKVVRQLTGSLLQRDCHLATGFLGTPLLLSNLTRAGKLELAYRLLEQTTYPGWLYPVTQGATTMWERWNSFTLDGGFGEVGMNSFNHYAYGAVGDWFYETICGIQPIRDRAEWAGFRRFRLAPKPGGSLTRARAVYHSICGEIRSSWERNGNRMIWEFTVPVNTTAEIEFPTKKPVPSVRGIARDENRILVAHPGSYRVEFEL